MNDGPLHYKLPLKHLLPNVFHTTISQRKEPIAKCKLHHYTKGSVTVAASARRRQVTRFIFEVLTNFVFRVINEFKCMEINFP